MRIFEEELLNYGKSISMMQPANHPDEWTDAHKQLQNDSNTMSV